MSSLYTYQIILKGLNKLFVELNVDGTASDFTENHLLNYINESHLEGDVGGR